MMALLGALLTASCAYTNPATPGHALQGEGMPASGNLTMHAHPGRTYRFAMPMFHNSSKKEVDIESVSLGKIPSGVQVLGYPIYSLKQTGGLVVGSMDGDPGTPDMRKMTNSQGKPIVIPAGATGKDYAMAEIKISKRISAQFSDCVIHYKSAGVEYTQTLWCEFGLTAN
jgi:hypothetical protein